jgi:hypothetical protein
LKAKKKGGRLLKHRQQLWWLKRLSKKVMLTWFRTFKRKKKIRSQRKIMALMCINLMRIMKRKSIRRESMCCQ